MQSVFLKHGWSIFVSPVWFTHWVLHCLNVIHSTARDYLGPGVFMLGFRLTHNHEMAAPGINMCNPVLAYIDAVPDHFLRR